MTPARRLAPKDVSAAGREARCSKAKAPHQLMHPSVGQHPSPQGVDVPLCRGGLTSGPHLRHGSNKDWIKLVRSRARRLLLRTGSFCPGRVSAR